VPSYAKALTKQRVKVTDLKVRDASTGGPIKVSVGYMIMYYALEIKAQVFITNGWLRMSWKDERLAFSPELERADTIDCLSFIDDIWQPDIYLRNAQKFEVTE
jgi:hypothetical protein